MLLIEYFSLSRKEEEEEDEEASVFEHHSLTLSPRPKLPPRSLAKKFTQKNMDLIRPQQEVSGEECENGPS